MQQPGSNSNNSLENNDTIIKYYTKQLMSSGRTDNEITGDLEKYYT